MVKPRPKKLPVKPKNAIAAALLKPKPVNAAHEALVDKLYNRLQAGGGAHEAFQAIAKHVNVSYKDAKDMLHVATNLMERCDTTIKTMQLNHEADLTSYQVNMQYTDRTKLAVLGWFRPPQYAVITSHSLALAVTLAYLSVSKQVGRFI